MRIPNKNYLTYLSKGTRGALTHLRLAQPRKIKKLRAGAAFGSLYNLITQFTQTKLNKETYNLTKTFSDYVHTIDIIIDNPNYTPRQKAQFSVHHLKQSAELNTQLNKFVNQLKRTKLTKEQKNSIIKLAAQFRRKTVKEVEETMKNPFDSKENTLRGVEQTTGEFLGTIAQMHAIMHNLSLKQTTETKKNFKTIGCALQLRDDFRDCALDYGHVQNTTVSVAQKYPKELEKIQQRRQQNIPRDWARKNIPKTFFEITQTFEKYIEQLPNNPQANKLAKMCRSLFYM